ESASSVLDAAKLIGTREWHQINKNDWSGDLFDLENIKQAFFREELANDFNSAIKDVTDPGVIGDLILCNFQGEQLAIQERAFRARHMSKVAAELAAAGRKLGQSSATGVIMRGIVGYAEGVAKASKV